MRLLHAAIMLSLAACSQQPSDTSASDEAKAYGYVAPIDETYPPAERFDPAAVEAAESSFMQEPNVAAVFYDPSNTVEWHIAVKDDGSKRYGLAGYFCLKLREMGVYDDNVDVRVIDAARISEFQDAYREYSLGGVQCTDEAQIW